MVEPTFTVPGASKFREDERQKGADYCLLPGDIGTRKADVVEIFLFCLPQFYFVIECFVFLRQDLTV